MQSYQVINLREARIYGGRVRQTPGVLLFIEGLVLAFIRDDSDDGKEIILLARLSRNA